MNPKTILLVDDERPILKAFQRIFMDTDYEILTANSAMEALGLLTSNKVHMIISDMRMPEMDGYELLEKVKLLYPSIIRIILSGYSDETAVLRALQRNLAKL
ncbi:MAG: hypothetical protein PWP24_299, partial [Clostridiales bacterium]|nr:hypothetical protein [Clostridiales bacterium]